MGKRVDRLFLGIAFILYWGGFPNNLWGGGRMEIQSSAFKDGGKIPIQYVMVPAGGKNLSLPLSWKDAPSGTKSFALSIVDPHPVAQNWVHWLVIDIPANATSLEEGASGKKMPPGAVELKNSFGQSGYGGPQPPKGSSLTVFKKALEGKVIQSASITGKYEQR
jgi:Raf kinase inhibitor-like YbhB/YbcL family protein